MSGCACCLDGTLLGVVHIEPSGKPTIFGARVPKKKTHLHGGIQRDGQDLVETSGFSIELTTGDGPFVQGGWGNPVYG